MKVLVLGGSGLLGEALMQRCKVLGHAAVAAWRSSPTLPLDIADRRQLADALEEANPDLVVNCAAIASIDACEADPGKAYAVNAAAVADLAQLSRAARFKLAHISTDHFFTGAGRARHTEDATVTLVNEYAKIKYAAEKFAGLADNALVVRTAFVGRSAAGEGGFAAGVYRALRTGQELVLFEDAYSSLLHRADVADLILRLIEREASGVYNVASRDVFSKAELVRAFAHKLGLPLHAQSGSVTSLQTPRAESLGLATEKAEALLGRQMPGLEDTVGLLAADFPIERAAERKGNGS